MALRVEQKPASSFFAVSTSVLIVMLLFTINVLALGSSIQHPSSDDCPDDKREDYQNCSVLCCVQQLCTVICTHTYIHEQFLKLTVGLGLHFLRFMFAFSVFAIVFLCCWLLLC